MFLPLLPLLTGCALVTDADLAARMDLDGDGVSRPTDCDDADPAIGAADGLFVDEDFDGYGGTLAATTCDIGNGVSATTGDCNDADPAVFPSATEICNEEDDDCDGTVDDGVEPTTWYFDGDGDGYGTPFTTIVQCTQPAGYVTSSSDCNDADTTINPDTLWYPDADGDGFGDTTGGAASCEQPAGAIRDGSDCDDSRADVNPAGQEVCDDANADEDCDGMADDSDDSATGFLTWYLDGDGDGRGTVFTTVQQCDAPAGYVDDRTDCDDADPDPEVSLDCRWVQVTAGYAHTCALRGDGSAACWGANDSSESDVPEGPFKAIAAGDAFTCGILTSGAATCWGRDDSGQADPPEGTFVQVSADIDSACAVGEDGTPTCWGDTTHWDAPPAEDVVSTSIDYDTFCALSSVGTIDGAGDIDDDYQWAEATNVVQVEAVRRGCAWLDGDGNMFGAVIGNLAGPLSVFAIDDQWGFSGHLCGINLDGSMECRGAEAYGGVAPPGTFTAVSAGYSHTCAITSDGFLQCWGDDSYGQTDAPTD